MKFEKFHLGKFLLGLFISLVHIIPFYITITVALKSKSDNSSRWSLPALDSIYWENFSKAITEGNLLLAMRNSLIITSVSIVLIVGIGAMAAYPLARIRTKFNAVVLNFALAVMMVPPLSMLVPLYKNLADLGGINTFWGGIVVITTFQLPLSIFLYSNFIKTIPKDLDEAASIDGASRMSIFWRIILPLLKPVTATVVILTGVWVWNDYQFSVFILNREEVRPLTLAISGFFSSGSNDFGAAAAAALIAILPIVILYVALQKYFVKGAVDGAVK